MIKLRIDNKEVSVPENTSVMKAAESAGVQIPAMCFMEGYTNHPSCMVCLVKDKVSGNLFPSCAMPVAEGMEVITGDEEVHEARKEALELLLSDHVGDCEAPCRNGCPAFMDIPLMNRLIAAGKFREALITVKEEIALPLILGYICEAPCEKVCRRVPIDEAVSICQLKKFVAARDIKSEQSYLPEKEKNTGKKVAVLGAGPAGLAASFYLTRWGHQCVVFDKNKNAGGALLQLSESVMPKEVLEAEISILRQYGVGFRLDQKVDSVFFEDEIKQNFDSIILATGESLEPENKTLGILFDAKGFLVNKDTWETNIPGIFACGSAVRKQKMAIHVVAQGKEAARAVNNYLLGKNPGCKHKMFNSRFGKLKPEEYKEYLKEAIPDGRLTPGSGELQGFSMEEAIQESKRCMHCDCRKPVQCKLRIYSDEYGADRRKYLSGERKTLSKHFNHENIVYEAEKCIKCGLCVEITVKDKELTGLSFVGRGFDVKVDVPFNKTLHEALTKTAAKCAEACPTGAISIKIIL